MRTRVALVSLLTAAMAVLMPYPSSGAQGKGKEQPKSVDAHQACLKAASDLADYQIDNQITPISDLEASTLKTKLQAECNSGPPAVVAKQHMETLSDIQTMLPNFVMIEKYLDESMRATCANFVAYVFAYKDSRSEFKNTKEKSSFLIQGKNDCAYSRDPYAVMNGYTKYYVRSLAISNAEIATDEAEHSDEWRRELMEKFAQNSDTFYFACVATVAETNKLSWATQRDITACADDVSGVWREAAQEVGFDKWLENRTPKPLPEKAYTVTSSKGPAPTM